jgi:hypothetical protein
MYESGAKYKLRFFRAMNFFDVVIPSEARAARYARSQSHLESRALFAHAPAPLTK